MTSVHTMSPSFGAFGRSSSDAYALPTRVVSHSALSTRDPASYYLIADQFVYASPSFHTPVPTTLTNAIHVSNQLKKPVVINGTNNDTAFVLPGDTIDTVREKLTETRQRCQ